MPAAVRRAVGGLPATFWYLWTGMLVNRLGGFVVPLLALYLTGVRHLSVEQAGFTVALFGAGSIGGGPLGGHLSDRIGRRPTLLVAMTLAALAMLDLGFAVAPLHIAAATFALGFCGSTYRPAVSAAIADVVPAPDRPRAYGLIHWAVNIGFTVAVVIAGIVAEHTFTPLFVGDALTTLAFGLIVWLKVPETRPTAGTAPGDLGGSPYQDGLFCAFVLIHVVVATVFHQYTSTLALDVRAHGVTTREWGLLSAVNGLLIIVLQPVAFAFLQRFARPHVLAASALLIGLGFGLTGLVSTLVGYGLTVAVWTLGEIAMSCVGPSVVADFAPTHRRGAYQGLYGTAWGASSFFAPALGSLLLGRCGAGVLWSACLGAGLVAAIGHLVLGRAIRRRRAETPPAAPAITTA